jgi:hypothetical protein
MRSTSAAFALILCCARIAAGQVPPATGQPAGDWASSASVYIYQVAEDDNYAQPTVTTDHGSLHLEGRFNYEDLHTGSAWIGYNLEGGKTVEWELTPMLGGVFGSTSGLAPGYKGSLTWRRLGVSSEGEFLFAVGDASENFFYNWSELAFAPAEWWRFGLATQRTHAYASDRDIQRGLFAGFTYRALDSAVYVFNPDDSHPTVVVAVTVGF